MTFHIPKSLQLMGQTICIERRLDLVKEEDAVGSARWRRNTILIQASSPAYSQSPSQMGETFCHELVHFVLHAMHEHKLQSDERFVTLFGALLYQALSTSEGDLDESMACRGANDPAIVETVREWR